MTRKEKEKRGRGNSRVVGETELAEEIGVLATLAVGARGGRWWWSGGGGGCGGEWRSRRVQEEMEVSLRCIGFEHN